MPCFSVKGNATLCPMFGSRTQQRTHGDAVCFSSLLHGVVHVQPVWLIHSPDKGHRWGSSAVSSAGREASLDRAAWEPTA